jgi:uncharacterized protein YbbC (DUF1343 family)
MVSRTADGEHIVGRNGFYNWITDYFALGNKKPTLGQQNWHHVFDLQDVELDFTPYISSYNGSFVNIELIIWQAPNPNGNIVDGPILEKEFTSFVGMHPIPVLHGMTIGEYSQMINGEHWLKKESVASNY